jgi:hypothetical protein
MDDRAIRKVNDHITEIPTTNCNDDDMIETGIMSWTEVSGFTAAATTASRSSSSSRSNNDDYDSESSFDGVRMMNDTASRKNSMTKSKTSNLRP